MKIKRKDQYIETPFNDDGTIHLFKRDRIEFNCSRCGRDVDILAQNLTSQGQHYNNLLPDSELLCKSCLYKKTNLEKYGVENIAKLSNNKEKPKREVSAFKKKERTFIETSVKTKKTVLKKEKTETKIIPQNEIENNVVLLEELFQFVSSFGKETIRNDKTVISPIELDIVIPEINLAIEFNGLYSHSVQSGKDKDYHLRKTILCKEKGYSLMQIFEDEWVNKKEIVKSMISSRFNIFERKVFARKCVVKVIEQKQSKDFFNDNHLQGNVGSSLSLGLFERNSNELLSCLSLGKTRFNKNFDWEITRFAVKKNITVIGGFSKLWKYFLNNYEGDVITYSDRRLFNGEVYRRSSFTEQTPSSPNYFYFTGNKERYSRVKFQKHKLGKQLAIFDENKTEKENMQDNGYYWIYDCGNWVFTYRRGKND